MTIRLKTFSVLAGTLLVAIALATTVAGQQQPPPAPGGAARGRGEPPPPPAAQAGHPQGKLVIWGDIASFDNPPTLPTHCILTNRFKRGQRVGFRMTAIDGGTGEAENTTTMVVHVNYMGMTIDVPTRWRGVGGFPAAEYPQTAIGNVDGCVGRADGCAAGTSELHRDGHRSLRPDRHVFAVHQRRPAAHRRRIDVNHEAHEIREGHGNVFS